MPEDFKFSDQQEQAIGEAVARVLAGVQYRIAGFAGSGKTSIASAIIEKLAKEGMVEMPCSFTGKATQRLREKGVTGAETIHSTVCRYDPGTRKFILKEPQELPGDYFLVDETSMVSTQLLSWLEGYGLPIIWIGDSGQLPPIGDNPDLMADPDITLESIYRQGEGSKIIDFSYDIRHGHTTLHQVIFGPEMWPYGTEVCVQKGTPKTQDVLWADVSICRYNTTRCNINDLYRRKNGFKKNRNILEPGERIVVLQNNLDFGVFNGQMLTVESVGEWKQQCLRDGDPSRKVAVAKVRVNDGMNRFDIPLAKCRFGAAKKVSEWYQTCVVADYGYAITCHKSQGSEWDNVVVFDEPTRHEEDAIKWQYTAITRASKNLRYFVR